MVVLSLWVWAIFSLYAKYCIAFLSTCIFPWVFAIKRMDLEMDEKHPSEMWCYLSRIYIWMDWIGQDGYHRMLGERGKFRCVWVSLAMAGLVTSHPPAPTSHLQTPTSHLPPPTKLSPPTHQTKSLSYQPLSQCIAHRTNVRSLKLQCLAQMCPMLHCHIKNLSLQCIAHCTNHRHK